MEKEYIEIVRSLNVELYENFGEEEKQFSYSTNGFSDLIWFQDEILWNSDDDEREYNEITNEYEDLEIFIRKQFNKYVEQLNKLIELSNKRKL